MRVFVMNPQPPDHQSDPGCTRCQSDQGFTVYLDIIRYCSINQAAAKTLLILSKCIALEKAIFFQTKND